jgi:methyl-accepting chemotaxis protein
MQSFLLRKVLRLQ